MEENTLNPMNSKIPKYRLVKKTLASGYVQWNIERKIPFLWWEFVDGYFDERKARTTLDKLRDGTPYSTREVVG